MSTDTESIWTIDKSKYLKCPYCNAEIYVGLEPVAYDSYVSTHYYVRCGECCNTEAKVMRLHRQFSEEQLAAHYEQYQSNRYIAQHNYDLANNDEPYYSEHED